ncbi:unnamed protein product [Caenorhabditis auriculariae]|uniref:glucuronosyltransferase n=1 Tax=Caenorhabditis auriculariae TaxID=2777116 RepID=A0A8S1HRV2_9PELO|nr:unnamed protein product [Caenorhabditis auriculariae]
MLVALFGAFLVGQSFAYNYLVYNPLFAHSHASFLGKLADTLTDAGHNVTMFAPVMNYRLAEKPVTKSTTDIITMEPDEYLNDFQHQMDNADFGLYWIHNTDVFSTQQMIDVFNMTFHRQCELLSENQQVLQRLKNKKYDVILFEPFNVCAFNLRRFLEIPTMIISTSLPLDEHTSRYIGEPIPASYVPGLWSHFGEVMNLKERMWNVFEQLFYRDATASLQPEIFRKLGVEPYDITEEFSKTSFVFVNSNPYIDFPRPTLHKTVGIGGITVNVTKIRQQTLEKNWHELLNAKTKTVLVSFGSVMFSKDMPIEYKLNLVRVMKSFPDVTFIWKYEDDDVSFAKDASNIVFTNWVPQSSLLADARLSAFVTHAGLASATELSYLGIPAITVPLFADQMRNARMLERHGNSISIDKLDLGHYETIKDALQRILYEEEFTKNAKLLAEQLATQPISPRELVIRHAEFAAKFGQIASLDPQGRKLSTFQYYLGDVALVILATVFLVSLLLLKFFRLLSSFLFRSRSSKRKTE